MDIFGCYTKEQKDEEKALKAAQKTFPKPSQVFAQPEKGLLNTDFIPRRPKGGFIG